MEYISELALSDYKLQLTHTQISKLEIFEDELIEWNKKFSLTAIRTREGIRIKHFLDSFSLYPIITKNPGGTLIDVGTGAGFPGIPLKIIFPNLRIFLIESVGKKVTFCNHIIDKLDLSGISTKHERIEDCGHLNELRESADWVVGRAVAQLPILAEYMLPLVKMNGYAIAMKGDSAHQEANEAKYAIATLGGCLEKIIPVQLPKVVEPHNLILLKKIAPTPNIYPRRIGVPAKLPLNNSAQFS